MSWLIFTWVAGHGRKLAIALALDFAGGGDAAGKTVVADNVDLFSRHSRHGIIDRFVLRVGNFSRMAGICITAASVRRETGYAVFAVGPFGPRWAVALVGIEVFTVFTRSFVVARVTVALGAIFNGVIVIARGNAVAYESISRHSGGTLISSCPFEVVERSH